MTKPRPEQFQISQVGMRHIPTQAMFNPFPGNLTSGNWRDGELGKPLKGRVQYDAEEVKEMGRKLWGEYLLKNNAER